MSDLYFQTYHFPKSVQSARKRVRALEEKARKLGLNDEAEMLEAVNAAWDVIVERARLDARESGGEFSMGVDRAD